jgi:predicted lipoprotein with Yx(FWY)xxD motif
MSLSVGSRAILASVAVIAIVAGCSSSSPSATPGATVAAGTPGAPAATTPAATTPVATPAPSAAATANEVDVVTDALGAHITGVGGKTLYLRTSDSTNTTTCTGGCTSNWPPFTLAAGATVTAGTGVTGALSTFARPDGSMQVTIAGHPLYYFAGDSAAGQTNGQGLAGVWFVASPAGAKVG